MTNKQYRELDFCGFTIENAVEKLLEYNKEGKLISTEFNGVMLYSDTVTMDSAYKEITGKTKAEFDEMIKNQRLQREKEELEHKAQIPELTKYWIKRGEEVLSKDKLERWGEIVPIRLGDLYRGMELGCTLQLVEVLRNGTLDDAKIEIENQNHSGMSFSLVCAMVKEFSDGGLEFVEYIS